MQAKKTVCFFTALFLVYTITGSARALPAVTVSFHGEGVTIDLMYPEEAHPEETITHNITITANTALTMDFTTIIYAPVNSSWQEVRRQTLTDYDLPEDGNFTSNLGFLLPQEAEGTLYCYLNVSTNVNNNYLSATLYTTLVSEPTFSEMRVLYDEMLANYTSLIDDYETLFNDYNEIFANYTNLLADYETLLGEYNQIVADHETLLNDYDELSANYSSLNATYMALLSEHNQLTTRYNSKVSEYDTLDDNFRDKIVELDNLETIYSSLNETYYNLQTDFNNLQIERGNLNQSYTNLQTAFDELEGRLSDSEGTVNSDRVVMFIFIVAVAVLIAFIVYIKRKQEDPYLVIRKETVSMKSDEET